MQLNRCSQLGFRM